MHPLHACARVELERWPQYLGRLLVDGAGRAHVRLPTFQYFLFWFAFYVLRSGQTAAEPARMRGSRYLAPSLGAVKKARACGASSFQSRLS